MRWVMMVGIEELEAERAQELKLASREVKEASECKGENSGVDESQIDS